MKKQSNIMYWYKCGRTECDDEYIGESASTFEEIYKEHLKAQSPIFEHNNATGHTTSVENFKIIEGRDMVWPEPSNINTTCHIFGMKFCLPSQNKN